MRKKTEPDMISDKAMIGKIALFVGAILGIIVLLWLLLMIIFSSHSIDFNFNNSR